ncbi:MAG: aspartate--ammonia ligase [Lachnospiraceae bacterium]|nr:aspartate--ammonia ligase [Lachnospiraceae bacterium]
MIDYRPKLSLMETQAAIRVLKHRFEVELCDSLHLTRASAPMFVKQGSGLNDNLNGVERPVTFDTAQTGEVLEVVHSLAKWKRYALYQYGIPVHQGIYTDMNAIRRDEICDSLHSLYVDQWDWEMVITEEDRTEEFLKETVQKIYGSLLATMKIVHENYPALTQTLPGEIHFITTQELEDRYPHLTPKQREDAAAREYGAVFLMKIGGLLASGQKHDGRAPDYDDWNLNGDIILHYDLLDSAFEISSMGIRVDRSSLVSQLEAEHATDRLELDFHKKLMDGTLPLSIGGGIGQSRLCMYLLEKAHIGEVQASVWPDSELRYCKENGISLL